MYLYMAQEEIFDAIPSELLEQFGTPEFVMQLDLHAGRELAREDVISVIANLVAQGFHLQMPPKLDPYLYEGD